MCTSMLLACTFAFRLEIIHNIDQISIKRVSGTFVDYGILLKGFYNTDKIKSSCKVITWNGCNPLVQKTERGLQIRTLYQREQGRKPAVISQDTDSATKARQRQNTKYEAKVKKQVDLQNRKAQT